jgi:aspartyl-tRNA(Asn)/glutamyl-tRNA(Gln) amidotransferase subunit C
MKITQKEIKKLALLSKIRLSEKELVKFTKDMDTILTSVETLDNFEKETGYKIKEGKFDKKPFDTLREDVVESSMSQEDALFNAPQQENGYFKVSGTTFDKDNS